MLSRVVQAALILLAGTATLASQTAFAKMLRLTRSGHRCPKNIFYSAGIGPSRTTARHALMR